MPVPAPLPQTSQAAEFAAIPMLHRFLEQGVRADVATDCRAVVHLCKTALAQALNGRRVYAGIVRPAITCPSWKRQVEVRKVKAHVKAEGLEEGPAKEDALGNDLADAEAKRARQLHPQPAPAVVK